MSDVDDITCGLCGDSIEGEVVDVAGEAWHQACAVRHVIGSLAELAPSRRGLLTPREVASQLGESVDSVTRRKERIGFVRLRRDGVPDERAPIRFRQEDVDRYIDENFEPPADGEELSRVRRRPRPAVVERNPHLLPRRLRQERSA